MNAEEKEKFRYNTAQKVMLFSMRDAAKSWENGIKIVPCINESVRIADILIEELEKRTLPKEPEKPVECEHDWITASTGITYCATAGCGATK